MKGDTVACESFGQRHPARGQRTEPILLFNQDDHQFGQITMTTTSMPHVAKLSRGSLSEAYLGAFVRLSFNLSPAGQPGVNCFKPHALFP